MQNYDTPKTGVTTFPQLYAMLVNTLETLRSNFSGTSFPTSPMAGQPCLRMDRVVGGVPQLYRFTGDTTVGESGWISETDGSSIGQEVINARGSKPSVDQRLDMAMNEDGTLKAGTSLNPSQWTIPSLTFTYVSTSSFKVNGDQTDIYKSLRRLKVNLASTVAYSEVVSSTYSSGPNETTIQIYDTILDSGLVSVEHSIFLPDKDNSAISSRMIGRKRIKTITGTYTTTLNDEILLADASAGGFTINLLSAATMGSGREIEIIKIDSSANAVTVDPAGSEIINGSATVAISSQYGILILMSDGANLKREDITILTVPLSLLSASAAHAGYPQSGTGGETLRTIRGKIWSDGSIAFGTGFTVSKSGTGGYNIFFTTHFGSSPTINANLTGTTRGHIYAENAIADPTAGAFIGTANTSDAPTDANFMFAAVGPA